MLFRSDDIDQAVQQAAERRPERHGVRSGAGVGKPLHAELDLGPIFGQLRMDTVVDFYTDGRWSLHQLVRHLLTVTGPADVYLATWTITEDPVRSLVQLKQAGQIRALYGLFNHKVRERAPGAFHLAREQFTAVGEGKVHAKVTVIMNEQWALRVVGSANYSRNPRLEAGDIVLNRQSAEFHRDVILKRMP
jgi:hypothetical protein